MNVSNYLNIAKQIELEARFNIKMKRKNIDIPVYFEYQPHKDLLVLACKCSTDKTDKIFMCAVEIDFAHMQDAESYYTYEEKMLDELRDIYLDRLNELAMSKDD